MAQPRAEVPDYRADVAIDPKTNSIRKKNVADSYARRLGGEIPTVILGIAIVVGCFIGYTIYSHLYTDTTNSDKTVIFIKDS